MGNTFGPNGFSSGSILHSISSKSEIIVHEGDEPDAVGCRLDADFLIGKDLAEIDLAAIEADASAGGDGDRLIMEGVIEIRQAL